MGFNDDYYWTGGGFKDWSGKSAGKFSSSSGASSGGSGGNGKGPKFGWKMWLFSAIVFLIFGLFFVVLIWGDDIGRWIVNRARQERLIEYREQSEAEAESAVEEAILDLEKELDVEIATPMPVSPSKVNKKATQSTSKHHRRHSSRSYYDEDDEDDEDEDIIDKRQYDDYDDDEADDWE